MPAGHPSRKWESQDFTLKKSSRKIKVGALLTCDSNASRVRSATSAQKPPLSDIGELPGGTPDGGHGAKRLYARIPVCAVQIGRNSKVRRIIPIDVEISAWR